MELTDVDYQFFLLLADFNTKYMKADYFPVKKSWGLAGNYALSQSPAISDTPCLSTEQSSQVLHWDFTSSKGKVQDERSWEMEEEAVEPITKTILKK